ncbi:MAG TPA: hypothetical protein VLE46_07880, partial [Nitrospira sp.]|nr:hypothetical protein [Nitrospira sp.]
MNILLIGIVVGLISVWGFATPSLAGETSAAMEKMKGESKALVEEGKGQTKGAIEDVKGNKTSAEVERAKGTAKAET